MHMYHPEYLTGARKLTEAYGVHLIADEIMTGFGRTGKMFACEHAGIEPDFMCLSKGITSGYLPLAVTLTTDKVYDAFYDDHDRLKTFYHGHTYTANPISCAAAGASIDLFKEENTFENIAEINLKLKSFLPLLLPLMATALAWPQTGHTQAARNKDGSIVTGVIRPAYDPTAGLEGVPVPSTLFFLGTTDLTLNAPTTGLEGTAAALVDQINALAIEVSKLLGGLRASIQKQRDKKA